MGVYRSALRPVVIGASHRSSSRALRSAMAMDEQACRDFSAHLGQAGIEQAIVLSADDRVEILALHLNPAIAEAIITAALAERLHLTVEALSGYLYRPIDAAAIRHTLAVIGSLDGVIVGEPHILEEVRASHQRARDVGLCGADLESLMAAGYRVAGRIRAETAVGERPVSLPDVAVELAGDLHGSLAKCALLVIGEGETGTLIAGALRRAGAGSAVAIDPAGADIVVAAVEGRAPVLTAPQIRDALRQRRQKPIFLIDAGIPGDIDPLVNRLEGAYLYDLNDLERIAMQGRAAREGAARRAWAIVEAEVDNYLKGTLKTGLLPGFDTPLPALGGNR